MVKLVEQNSTTPSLPTPTNEYSSGGAPTASSTTSASSPVHHKYPTPPESTQQYMSTHDLGEHDLMESTAARNAHAITSCAVDCPNTPFVFPSGPVSMKYQKYLPLSKQLHALLPPLEVRQIICKSPGAKEPYFTPDLNSGDEHLAEKFESAESLVHIPSPFSHPSLIARRLMQYVLCIQQTPPDFDMTHVVSIMGKPLGKIMSEWATAVSTHVTPNDDLISNQEGLETLILYSYYLSDLGHLRKSWLSTRRALSMCQMMGIPKTPSMLRSCDPSADPTKKASTFCSSTWFRVCCNDRYLSLILGLPIGSHEDGFGEDEDLQNAPPLEKLGKRGSKLMRQICERNELPTAEAYAMTQKLDGEIEEAARQFADLWNTSKLSATIGIKDNIVTRYGMEVRHHTLLLMVHLPYVLRAKDDKRYEFNRTTCIAASKSILIKFLEFRSNHMSLLSGRHIDYSALVAAMTLLLGYVGRDCMNSENSEHIEAKKLVQQVKDKMSDMAALPGEDKLARESADILEGILSFTGKCSEGKSGEVHLNVPFLGRVNIVRDVWGTETNTWDTGIRDRDATGAQSVPPSCTPAQSTGGNGLPATFFSIDTQSLGGDASNNMNQGVMNSGDITGGLGGFDIGGGWPDLLAEPDDWALQGVDTTYWNMVNQGYTFDPRA